MTEEQKEDFKILIKGVLVILLIIFVVLLFTFKSALAINQTEFCELLGLNISYTDQWINCTNQWNNLTNGTMTETVYVNVTHNVTVNNTITEYVYLTNTTEVHHHHYNSSPVEPEEEIVEEDDEVVALLKELLNNTPPSITGITQEEVVEESDDKLTADAVREIVSDTMEKQKMASGSSSSSSNKETAEITKSSGSGLPFGLSWGFVLFVAFIVGVILLVIYRKKIIQEFRGGGASPPSQPPEPENNWDGEADQQKVLMENAKLKEDLKNARNKIKSKSAKKPAK